MISSTSHPASAAGALALAAACGLAAPAAAQLTEPFPAVFELEQLRDRSGGDGSLGFTLVSDARETDAGWSVSSAGDVNGDGIDDVIVGAPGYYGSCGYCPGYPSRSYVVFGRDSSAGATFPADLDLSTLDGSDGFRLDADPEGDDRGGAAVSSVGDMNGDGIDDLLVSAGSSSAFVVFGRDTSAGGSFPAVIDLYDLDGERGFFLVNRSLGFPPEGAVAGAGDVNGDGLADIIIGDDAGSPPGRFSAGQSFVVFGQRHFPGVFDLTTLDGENGFRIDGVAEFDRSGGAVASAGDINGDGLADVIIGAGWADPGGRAEAGQSYVVFGRDTVGGPGFPAVLDLAALDGSIGFALNGVSSGDYSGSDVGFAGDINADGVDDVVIGAPLADAGAVTQAGQSYVVFGRDTGSGPGFPPALELASLDGEIGFRLDGPVAEEQSGTAVASAGDLNGDGVADFVIGASGHRISSIKGTSYVVFGQRTTFPAAIDLASLDGAAGFRIEGSERVDKSGFSVATAGDVNGDSFPDLIIGAPGGPTPKAYIIYGRDATCYADCDGSGELDFFDFLCFQNQFAAGDPQADCDQSGELDFFDFLCFQNAFAAGCP